MFILFFKTQDENLRFPTYQVFYHHFFLYDKFPPFWENYFESSIELKLNFNIAPRASARFPERQRGLPEERSDEGVCI